MHMRKVLSPRTYCLAAIIALFVLYTYTFTATVYKPQTETNIRSCYQFPSNAGGIAGGVLEDILNAKTKPEPGRSIFFLITTCSENHTITLNQRQTCAIESAALHNPKRSVFVLFTSPVGLLTDSKSSFVSVLQSYANIHFLNLNLRTIGAGTPVEDFILNGILFNSSFLVEHMSDVLRLTLLYKFGGIYFDTDVVVLKNMDELPANFLGKEGFKGDKVLSVNNAVLGYQDATGHEILELCLKELTTSYKPDVWSNNGGPLLTRILEKYVCHTSLAEMTPKKCRGFKVYPKQQFYPINYSDWELLFNANYTEQVLAMVKKSSVVHFWNKLSHGQIITKSCAKTAYQALAEKNCPKAFKASGDYF